MSDPPDDGRDLSTLRAEDPPEVVRGAFRRFKRRLIAGGIAAALVGAGVAYYFAGIRPGSDIPSLEAQAGEENGPFHLIAQRRIAGEDWKMFVYRDQSGWPCMIGTIGGGHCPHLVGRIRGELGDVSTHANRTVTADGTTIEYLEVTGAVPRDVRSVLLEFDDGSQVRTETVEVPEFEERFFAVLSEGNFERQLVDYRDAGAVPD
jgi:hypothetical protein